MNHNFTSNKYSIPDFELNKNLDQTIKTLWAKGIRTYLESISYVNALPYGRNKSRNFHSVLIEGCGTCSSKHALLSHIANLHNFSIDLILGFFEMSEQNTPGVKKPLGQFNLNKILEAHCYLKYNDKTIDITFPNDTDLNLFILEEIKILPEDVIEKKVELHKKKLSEWLVNKNIDLTLEKAWQARETCIKHLSKNHD